MQAACLLLSLSSGLCNAAAIAAHSDVIETARRAAMDFNYTREQEKFRADIGEQVLRLPKG